MRIAVALVLVSALAATACKKDDPAPAGAPPATRSARPAAEQAGPTPTPTPARMPRKARTPPRPAAPPAPTVTYDCAALVTAQDVKEVCGAEVTVEKGEMEGRFASSTCARTIRRDQHAGIAFGLNVTSSAGASSLVTVKIGDDNPDETEREIDAGDVARLVRRPDKLSGGTHQAFVAAKGPVYVQLSANTDQGKAEMCSDDALVALGKRLIDRLP